MIQKTLSENITKDQIVEEIREFVVEPYIDKFEGEAALDVKVAEFLKAQEMICKLKGFFDKESGAELPEVMKLKLP